MKGLIRFNKAFVPAAFASLAIIAFGIFGLATKGLNLGVDFQAGINQYVQLAFPAGAMKYEGAVAPVLSILNDKVDIVFSGAGIDNKTLSWDLRKVGTIADLSAALSAEPGLSFEVAPDSGGLPATLVVPTYQGTFALGKDPIRIQRAPRNEGEIYASIDKVRASIASLGSLSVQNLGSRLEQKFIIRVSDDGKSADFSSSVPGKIVSSLDATFGAGRAIAIKTDFVAPKFAKDLAGNVWKLTMLTVFAILVYAAVRFRVEFAIGAVVAILHDAIIMIAFMVWTRMEFSSMSIAAILTILGYSINDTIVIFDRIREDRVLNPTDSLVTVINKAITETLGRTILTTVMTMLAVVALILFTTGEIHNFAIALFVGMVSGTYSTIFMASAFVILWDNFIRKRKNSAAKTKIDAAPKAATAK